MSTHERRTYFEELCRLRAIYRLRSDYDASAVMSIDDAIAYGSALLGRRESPKSRRTAVAQPSDRTESTR
jgi:hypothetical protein